MTTMIDLGTELLIDQSTLSDPYVRLMTAALGRRLVRRSPWVVVSKYATAALFAPPPPARPRRPARRCGVAPVRARPVH